MSSIRSYLVTGAAIGAAALGGATIAGAATSSTPATPAASGKAAAPHDPSKGGHMFNGKTEVLLTGTTAAKVKAAALAKVPGTVDRVLRWPDGYLTRIESGSWGAAEGARFELRRAGGSTLDV